MTQVFHATGKKDRKHPHAIGVYQYWHTRTHHILAQWHVFGGTLSCVISFASIFLAIESGHLKTVETFERHSILRPTLDGHPATPKLW